MDYNDNKYADDKYEDMNDEAPAPRSKGKEGRRLGSYTDLMIYRTNGRNGALKRLA